MEGTDMDYEKKYKDALIRAKQRWKCGDMERDILCYIFPELIESRDERIRREIIEHLYWAQERGSLPNEIYQSKKVGDWIEWLKNLQCINK